MKERIFIIISLFVIIGVLIALNATSFVRLERENDNEIYPNRSSLNAGATGTRAFYELLRETGKNVVRWQEPPSALLTSAGKDIKTFVVIGDLRQNFTEVEAKDLQDWVKAGGKLVIFDRTPDEKLLPTETAWKISTYGGGVTFFETANPANIKEMTNNVTALRPLQPTIFTKNIEAVMPSRFASGIDLKFESVQDDKENLPPPTPKPIAKPTPQSNGNINSNNISTPKDKDFEEDEGYNEPPLPRAKIFAQADDDAPPTPKPSPKSGNNNQSGSSSGSGRGSGSSAPPIPKTAPTNTPVFGIKNGSSPPPTPANASGKKRSIFDWIFDQNTYSAKPTPKPLPSKFEHSAPVIHLADKGKNLLVDYPFGAGQIVILSDPYIVANGGIQLVDNVQLALNLTDSEGTIAFDEFHQGYGARGTRLFQYFADTPLVSIFWQFAALIALFVWSRGRRFARPLPLPNPDRRSKLEYVAAMAELQKRTKSYDLALETIYTRTRRNISRAVGADNTTIKTGDLANLVAERTRTDKFEVRRVFERCEDVIHGEKTTARKVLDLIEKLREIETKLGLRRA